MKTSTNLLYSDTSSKTSNFITSFTDSGADIKITINSNSFSDLGIYSMKLECKFNNFNPNYMVSSSFNFNLLDPCSSNIITPSIGNETIFHMSGSGP